MSEQLDRRLTLGRRVAILVLALVAVVAPLRFGEREAATRQPDLEILVVLDRTRSMAAVDAADERTRWSVAVRDLVDLARALPGARFALISFATRSLVELPFTSDLGAFRTAVETVLLEDPAFSDGSRMDRPLEQATSLVQRAEDDHPDRRHYLVFASDGENTADGRQASYADLGDRLSGGVVLGYGTEEGARMLAGRDLDVGWVQDVTTGTDAISYADPANLRRVADELGVPYVARERPGGMAEVAAGFDAGEAAGGDEVVRPDQVWVVGILLALLLLWELFVVWREFRTMRVVLRPGGPGGDA